MSLTPQKTPSQRRRATFALRLSRRGQMAVLNLPAVRNQMVMHHRLFLVELHARLGRLISQNAFADLIGVPSSALTQWRRIFDERGQSGLLNQPMGRKAKGHALPPCLLTLAIKT